MANAGDLPGWPRRHPKLTILLGLTTWYFSWSFYVDSRPTSSAYYEKSYNPIPDARGEKTFLVESSGRFAESMIWAVSLPYEETSAAIRDAVAARFGIAYLGPRRFGQPPLGESSNTELISKPYLQKPNLASWKAIDGHAGVGSLARSRALEGDGETSSWPRLTPIA